MSKSTTPKTNSQKESPVKKRNNRNKSSKSASKKELKASPKHTGKIAKILSDMFSNKSAKFIKLHQLRLRTSEISSLTGAHPSFVHGVIARFKAKK